MSKSLAALVENIWYGKSKIAYLLLPLTVIFISLAKARQLAHIAAAFFSKLYCKIYFKFTGKEKQKVKVPIIVVGNITVGGTGKTPLVAFLVSLLKKNGKNPAIITSGYKGKNKNLTLVNPATKIEMVGDEPVMLYKATGAKVMVGRNRAKAIEKLLKFDKTIDVIISDDGLQNYSFAHDIKIAVVDGVKKFGNGFYLPAGPLRESPTALQNMNFIVVNNSANNESNAKNGNDFNVFLKKKYKFSVSDEKLYTMNFLGDKVYNMLKPNEVKLLVDFKSTKIHALSAIGNNNSFFLALKSFGLELLTHGFLDHYYFKPKDLEFRDNFPVIVTEKDAVKCLELFSNLSNLHDKSAVELILKNTWVYPIHLNIAQEFNHKLLELLTKKSSLNLRMKSIVDSWDKRKK